VTLGERDRLHSAAMQGRKIVMQWITARPVALGTGLLTMLIGLYLVVGGGWLFGLGGSLYYLVSGVVLVTVSVLLLKSRREALLLYAALLLGTMIWALWEVGLDFWSLAPRGDILVPLGIWLLLPFVTRGLLPGGRGAPTALAAVIILTGVVMAVSLTSDRQAINGSLAQTAAGAQVVSSEDPSAADWTSYGGTGFGDRFSALAQITPGNVKNLKLAWEFRTGDTKRPGDRVELLDEATPLKVGDLLYTCSPHQIVFAIEAATGALRWKFDPHLAPLPHLVCRGVAYHHTASGSQTAEGRPAPLECTGRIFLPTNDGRMFALDAETGKACDEFGDHGQIDLRQGSEVQTAGFYSGTSPPLATDKVLIVGGAVYDNYATHVPSGVIRGFDIYSGKLLWAFDAGNPDPNELPSPGHYFTAGSPNSWTVSAVDEKLGLAYIPLGSSAADIWGGSRTSALERYDSALIALDIATGKLRWSFQNVHHDLWDMDLPSQPSLVDVKTPNGVTPEIYVPAKTGDIFVLDRRDGHLIVPAPEQEVPQGAAPGDHLSPTQPFSQLSFRPREKLRERQMWGSTMLDQLACRIMFRRLRYDGPFTPPSLQGTLVFPGDFGMFEWGGIAVDAPRQIAIANPMSMPFVSRLIPRGEDNPPAPNKRHPPGTEIGVQPMYGTPYGVNLDPFVSPLGIPCLAPPWGSLAGIDLRTGRIAWQHRVGTIRDMAPVPVPFALGVPMLGGPIVTAGGVAFLTSTMDDYIRAFDVTTGDLVWQDRLPAGGQSTPMSYAVNGRQYIMTVDGGHAVFGTKLGDYIRAYTLPDVQR
jgi:quinoprotein glucose dehydrogenase